jgi:K+/H+ antiporter YhaU regulatory subunit KhtT
MAWLLLRPTVTELLDVIVRSGSFEMWLEEVRLGPESPGLERSLGQSRLREDLGITVLAIKRSSGTMLTNPPAETRLERGDVLVALGTRDALAQLERLAG